MTRIFCKLNNSKLDFFMYHNGFNYWLFTGKLHKGVYTFYKNGVNLNKALDFSKSKKDSALIKVMEKLPLYIHYIEKEENIQVLNKTYLRVA